MLFGSTQLSSVPVMPVTCSGTVHSVTPPDFAAPAVAGTLTQLSSCWPSASGASFFPPSDCGTTETFSMSEVARRLAPTKLNHSPVRKRSLSSGGPAQMHEWFGHTKTKI